MPITPPIAFEAHFLQGASIEHAFLVLRESRPDQPPHGWIPRWRLLRFLRGSLSVLRSGVGTVRDLWVSPTDVVHVVAPNDVSLGLCTGRPSASGYGWEWEAALGERTIHIEHAWGLSDAFFMAWGGGMQAAGDGSGRAARSLIDQPACWVWTVDGWRRDPLPGWVSAVRGHDEGSLYAVGDSGLTAHWDGVRWRELLPAETSIKYLQVTPQREVYGVSAFGDVLRCTSSGWVPVIRDVGYVTGFTHWGGSLYLLREDGVFRVDGGRLELVEPAVRPTCLAAGEGLMWWDRTGIHEWRPAGVRSIPIGEVLAVAKGEV